MDRSTIYTGEQGRSVDFLFAQRATMIGLGKLAQAALGSNTIVRGLAVTANSPAALNVLVGIGEIYTLTTVDGTAWGSLPADTTDTIIQQGLNMSAQTISTPAPATSGYSIVYLIEAQFVQSDTNSAVLPYYNSANPQVPLNGQGGNGQPQATQRQGLVSIQAKAGVAAPTGTQVAPSVDAGWTALATVTVANGQSTVTSGNIAIPAGVPQVSSLLQMMQTGSSSYAIDSSASANTVTVSLTPPITSYADGQPINFQAANTNTGACTINAGGGSVSLTGANGAFQGGEIVAGKFYEAVYRQNLGQVVVIGQSGGALQVSPATQSQHAPQMGQVGALQSVTATVASNALTGTLNAPTPLSFRNPTLTSGVPVSAFIASNLSLTVPSGATLGTVSGQAARIVWLVAYNGGTPALCVVNLSGGVNLDETTLISTTSIGAGSTAANVIYSSSAITSSPFRVVGFCDISEATAGTWATAPTTVQGIGGQALAALSSIGYGQAWQNVAGSRSLGTTYYNTTGKPIVVHVSIQSTSTNAGPSVITSGLTIVGSSSSAANTVGSIDVIIPPGSPYQSNMLVGGSVNNSGATVTGWFELR